AGKPRRTQHGRPRNGAAGRRAARGDPAGDGRGLWLPRGRRDHRLPDRHIDLAAPSGPRCLATAVGRDGVTIDRELLAAYADGELGPDEVARVEAAIAADPALAAELDAHRQLRATLSSHFAPILDMPVPDRLSAALKTSSNVVDLGEVRRAREATRSLSNI